MTAVPLQQNPRPIPAAVQAPMSVLSADVPGGISGFQRLGFFFLVIYLFLIYSRIFDVKFSYLHIPGITARIIMALVLLSRAFIPALKNNVGKSMLFLTIWFTVSIPTSMWRGGSTQILLDFWLPNFMVYLASAGLIVSFDQCRKAIHTVGYAFFVLAVIALVFGSTEETGRLVLPNGKFANPNEMAQALLLGMPLWWLMLQDSMSIGKKTLSVGVLFLMLVLASKTGSRGALVSFGVVLMAIFLRASIMGKLKLIIGGFVMMAVLVAIMPGKLLRRYATVGQDDDEISMTSGDYDSYMQASAVSSVQSRRDLLKKSLKYTFQHPLFGVGPGMFSVAENADAVANGMRRGSWQGTHNSYTQVSSEIGIPGAIAYVCAILFALGKTSKLYRKTRGDPRLESIGNCALALNYCLIVYAVSVFFDYIAFTSMLSVFAGLSTSLDANATAEIARRTSGPADPAPIPFQQFRPSWRRTAGVPQEA